MTHANRAHTVHDCIRNVECARSGGYLHIYISGARWRPGSSRQHKETKSQSCVCSCVSVLLCRAVVATFFDTCLCSNFRRLFVHCLFECTQTPAAGSQSQSARENENLQTRDVDYPTMQTQTNTQTHTHSWIAVGKTDTWICLHVSRRTRKCQMNNARTAESHLRTVLRPRGLRCQGTCFIMSVWPWFWCADVGYIQIRTRSVWLTHLWLLFWLICI